MILTRLVSIPSGQHSLRRARTGSPPRPTTRQTATTATASSTPAAWAAHITFWVPSPAVARTEPLAKAAFGDAQHWHDHQARCSERDAERRGSGPVMRGQVAFGFELRCRGARS